jgi:hypothetical protein
MSGIGMRAKRASGMCGFSKALVVKVEKKK